MQLDFKRFDKDWVMPVEGTLGNKAQNLFVNRDAAKAAGFKRPEAVVMPWEYLKAAPNPADFVLSVIDQWLPNWRRVYLRSNAPDEDNGQRIPGLYSTETIWHNDRDYAPELVTRVIESYDTVWARRSRKIRGVPETGMGLLLERAISEKPADCVGTYTQGYGWAKLLFVDPKEGHQAMTKPPLKECFVTNGKIERPCAIPEEKPATLKEGITRAEFIRRAYAMTEERIARQLDDLVVHLPKQEGKGWEIEFLAWLSDSYVAQITPVVSRSPITVPDLESAFLVKEVVGTGDYTLDGILTLPIGKASRLNEFDASHKNYTVLTPFMAVSGSDGRRAMTLLSLLNARAFVLMKTPFGFHEPLAAHVKQYLRNTGVAFSVLYPAFGIEQEPEQALYSPTKHRIVADEISGKGVVLLNEPLRPFEALKF